MSADKEQGNAEHVRVAPQHGALVEQVVVHDRSGWHRAWRLTKVGLLLFIILLVIAAAALWVWRKPIADDFIKDELERRGVQGSYTLDRVGFRTQQISNLVIGDPAKPDLTVRRAVIQLRILWNGSFEVYRIAARGVRLKGRLLPDGRVTWGQVDKLLPPPSGKPFRLPDISVDARDATIALATPYGPMGFALQGEGNLSGGFAGQLAASAPGLKFGACNLDRFRAHVDVGVTARRPNVKGPIGAEALSCPSSNLLLAQPRMEIDSSFAEGFDSFRGGGRLTMANFQAGANGMAGVVSNLTFNGTPARALGRIDLLAQQSRLDRIAAGRTRFEGRYRLEAGAGGLVAIGDYGANDVRVNPSLFTMLVDPLAALDGTPLGPIGLAISNSIRRAIGRFNVEGSLRLVNQRGGGAIRIETANAAAPTGAKIQASGGDGVTYYWPSGKMRIDGNFALQGGGLPTARIALSQPRSGAPMSGTATIAPYRVGNTRLAMAPIRFAAGRDGSTQLQTVALLDGPVPGGFVRGLRLPIDASFGGSSKFTFGKRCIEASFASFQMGSLRLNPARLPVCPIGPAIAYQGRGGAIQFGANLNRPRFVGSMGQSPFSAAASSARLLTERFALADLAVRMGRADSPVSIDAARLEGNYKGVGTFSGGTATLGRVPLLVSEASGDWRMGNGGVSISGGMLLAHRVEQPNFYPLRSDDMKLVMADGKINATGSLHHPASGTKITDVTIQHNLDNGNGNAVLDVPGVTFGPGLQPEELTRLSEGVVALVMGRLSGQGQINWTGSGEVTSTGEFTAHGMDLAASFGPVTGLTGTIRFTDLLGLQTAPGQTVSLASVNAGILVENGVIRYQLLPDNLVKIERGEWPFMGGQLILQETILNFGRPSPKRLTFEVVGLDAKTFVDSMGFKEISATGTFDGVLPMIFDDEGGRIVGGRLDSREGGGTLSYNGVVNKADLGMMGSLAFDALRDLKFRSMIIRLDGYLDGEFATRLAIQGVGLGNTSTQQFIKSVNRIPFNFNVTIKGPFRALIATAKSFRDPTQVIEPALPRPLDEVPGIVVETRRREESEQQSQTPVEQEITPTPTKQP
ncbi:YdbH domain-containing protein [Sphingomonas sp. NSE70-1]|uniref:YdbH domain-containing protein n=1 Tax=Sphingomonas caseinilyticus TaxID=2908205 RepID=A0ABT0RSX9_9SPHN|nr:YdbH domain-containing protein [Sphingomonas caseinilyticus]MCL6698031.1 YdbH domain-containing protein [Sphingomonas caseinilyticus]